MTEEELEAAFKKEFYDELQQDCWDYDCGARDCCECETYQECYEEYRQNLGYMPRILIGD